MGAHDKPTFQNPVSLTDFVVARLLDKVRRRKMASGKRLGTERALADELGVSVRAVREAVARLRILGIVDSRQGVGVTVACPSPTSVLGKVFPIYALQSGSLENLYLLRRSLELGAIDLAVRNASDQQNAELAALAGQYAHVPTGKAGVRRREKLGLAFHRTIMAATGNPFLEDLAEVIDVYFLRGAREMEGWATIKDKTTHLQIAEAFKARDARRAWELMRRHLQIWPTDGLKGGGAK